MSRSWRLPARKDQDSQAAQNQKAMAALLAQAGDFSLYGALYAPHPGADPAAGGPLCGPAGILGGSRRLGRGGHVPGKGGHHGKLASPICEFCGHLVDLALQTIYTNYKCSNMQGSEANGNHNKFQRPHGQRHQKTM